MDQAIRKQLKAALYAVLAVGLSALFSALFTNTGSDWYQALQKPPFQPPPIAFAIAWSILYPALAVALQRQIVAMNKKALCGFAAILTLTALWNYTFFELQNTLAAFILLVLCLIATVYTIRSIGNDDRLSVVLLSVFLVWIAFAATLSFYIYMAN